MAQNQITFVRSPAAVFVIPVFVVPREAALTAIKTERLCAAGMIEKCFYCPPPLVFFGGEGAYLRGTLSMAVIDKQLTR